MRTEGFVIACCVLFSTKRLESAMHVKACKDLYIGPVRRNTEALTSWFIQSACIFARLNSLSAALSQKWICVVVFYGGLWWRIHNLKICGPVSEAVPQFPRHTSKMVPFPWVMTFVVWYHPLPDHDRFNTSDNAGKSTARKWICSNQRFPMLFFFLSAPWKWLPNFMGKSLWKVKAERLNQELWTSYQKGFFPVVSVTRGSFHRDMFQNACRRITSRKNTVQRAALWVNGETPVRKGLKRQLNKGIVYGFLERR